LKEINNYDIELGVVAKMTWFKITKTTGCFTSCTVRGFTFAECNQLKVTWKHDWSSAFYLEPKTTEVAKTEEFLVFDLSDTISGIGGSLGLFLGWSVLYVIQNIFNGMKRFFNYLLSIYILFK
jgi:hypothetical protein